MSARCPLSPSVLGQAPCMHQLLLNSRVGAGQSPRVECRGRGQGGVPMLCFCYVVFFFLPPETLVFQAAFFLPRSQTVMMECGALLRC